MGFLSWLWDRIKSLFGFGDSRYKEEKEEEKEAKTIVKDTEEEEADEIIENKLIKEIVAELIRIHKKLSREKSPVEIRMGQRVITIVQALEILINHLEQLINTKESVTEEERDLKPIEDSWLVVRQGLVNVELHKDVEKVSSLFKKLNITVEKERKLSWQKIQAAKKLWEEMQKSEGGAKKQKSPSKVKV